MGHCVRPRRGVCPTRSDILTYRGSDALSYLGWDALSYLAPLAVLLVPRRNNRLGECHPIAVGTAGVLAGLDLDEVVLLEALDGA